MTLFSNFLKRCLLALTLCFTLFSCQDQHAELPDGLYADIETSKGVITVALNYEKAPVTVANFISLAEGKNTFVADQFKGKPFFDGLKFHRVIPEFMIQGGDPLGNGSGDTGYRFRDEIAPDLHFDKGGVLAMANSGPGTNSSQFFITHVATPWLEGRHTIFGEVVGNSMDVVNQIAQDDEITSVKIIRKGEAAKKFDAPKVFADFFAKEAENLKQEAAQKAESQRLYTEKFKAVIDKKAADLEALKKTATKTKTGLRYAITQKGSGPKPKPGQHLSIHYAGFLENGSLFDTSLASVAKTFGTYDEMRERQHGYEPIPFMAGRKDGMIPGFIEGIEQLSYGDKAVLFIPSHLAYGPQGAGNGVIPPNANIIFEVEMVYQK